MRSSSSLLFILLLSTTSSLAFSQTAKPGATASVAATHCGVALAYATVNLPITVNCPQFQADLAPIASQLEAMRRERKLTDRELTTLIMAMNLAISKVMASQEALAAKIDGVPSRVVEQMKELLNGVADGTKTGAQAASEVQQWKEKYSELQDKLHLAAELSSKIKTLIGKDLAASSRADKPPEPELISAMSQLDELLKDFKADETTLVAASSFNGLPLSSAEQRVIDEAVAAAARASSLLPPMTFLVPLIAQRLLSEKANAKVRELLGNEVTLGDPEVALWADYARMRKPPVYPPEWRYVDIPADVPSYEAIRDCPTRNCLAAALETNRQDLANSRLDRPIRARALKLLIALVADAHRVMHCINRQDGGGNRVRVRLSGSEKPTNLHHIWDERFLRLNLAGQKPASYAELLVTRLDEASLRRWQAGDPLDWINETHRIAREQAYREIPEATGLSFTHPLSAAYIDAGRKIVDVQALKAGARLASLLNRAFN